MVINEEKELSYKQKYKADHFELYGHHVIFFLNFENKSQKRSGVTRDGRTIRNTTT